MDAYYNEWDAPTAEWLRQICAGHHLPAGHVDTRSIRDVRAEDVRGYDQAHFFAGIGGWPLALRLAGYGHLPCWTGSPPCQPFSVAGQQRGNDDERHLAPVWLDLVRECKPPILFGEQVEAAIGHGWLDDLFDALEAEGYACGAAVLPACSVGAPHIRKRLFFGAIRLADAHQGKRRWLPDGEGRQRDRAQAGWVESHGLSQSGGVFHGIDDTSSARCFGPLAGPEGQAWDEARMCMPGAGCADGRLAHSDDTRPQGRERVPERADEQPVGARSLESGSAYSHHGGWSGADWLGCRDGKFRPVEPGTQPLASGLPARVVRLRGYGNAIVPAVAAAFIQEFLGAFAEIQENTGG
ncbi:DNA cytosine methyltransferase [Komagataeibacter sp. FNDCR1]|nr:DNA cytosine methyltransferase [Komagataeibacter sp. FNDCR1]